MQKSSFELLFISNLLLLSGMLFVSTTAVFGGVIDVKIVEEVMIPVEDNEKIMMVTSEVARPYQKASVLQCRTTGQYCNDVIGDLKCCDSGDTCVSAGAVGGVCVSCIPTGNYCNNVAGPKCCSDASCVGAGAAGGVCATCIPKGNYCNKNAGPNCCSGLSCAEWIPFIGGTCG